MSTTPCGHVFHTNCIEKWFQEGQNECAQCRKRCMPNQLIKLFFSEDDSEHDLVRELEEENRKLQVSYLFKGIF